MFLQVHPVDTNGNSRPPMSIRASAIEYISSQPAWGSKGRLAYYVKGELKMIGTVETLSDLVTMLDDGGMIRQFFAVTLVDMSSFGVNAVSKSLPFDCQFNADRIVAVSDGESRGGGKAILSTATSTYDVMESVGEIMVQLSEHGG